MNQVKVKHVIRKVFQWIIFKAIRKIGSIAIRAVAFYVLLYAAVLFSVLIAEAVTGYTWPDNPIESDYPAPILFDVLAFFLGPYVFWLFAVAAYDLMKKEMENE